jgi:hypothetical protein
MPMFGERFFTYDNCIAARASVRSYGTWDLGRV